MTEKTLVERIEEITLAATESELHRIIDEALQMDGRYTEWVALPDGKTFERWYAPLREREAS